MKKIVLLFLFFVSFNPDKVSAWTNGDTGIQKFHQTSVPQINSSGKIQNSYTSDSFFPLGLYWFDSRYLQQIKDAGFNMVWEGDWAGVAHDSGFYDRLNQYGIKITPHLRGQITQSIQQNNWNILTNYVNSIKNNPAVLAWYLTDEGYPASNLTTSQWLDGYNHLKALDPDRAVMGEIANSPMNGFSGCFPLKVDLSNTYSYPIVSGLDSLFELTWRLDTYMKFGCPWPSFVILQAFKGDSWPVMPTPEQVRGQMYAAIAHGATGVWLFVGFVQAPQYGVSVSGIAPGMPQWDAASVANHEIEANKKIFLSKTSTDEYHIAFNRGGRTCMPISDPYCQGCGDPDDNGNCRTNCSARGADCSNVDGCDWHATTCSQSTTYPLHTILKDAGESGVRYLLAVNLDATTLEGQFTFTKKINRVTSLFDGRSIIPVNMAFTDGFGSYGYRLYKIEFEGSSNPPANDPLPIGSYDADYWTAGCTVSGWTCDPSNYGASVPVNVYVDGTTPANLVVVSTTANTVHNPADPGPNNQCGGTAHDFDISNNVVRQALIDKGLDPNISHRYRPLAVNIDSSGNTRAQDAQGNWLTTWLTKYISDTATCVVPPTPINISDLRHLLQNFTNIFDYNSLVGNFGSP